MAPWYGGARKPYCKFAAFPSRTGPGWQSSGPAFRSRPWMRIPGATRRSASLGAAASRATFGSLTSKRVRRRRCSFWRRKRAAPATSSFATLKAAFESENRLHPRQTIQAALTTAICQARASWLLDDVAHRAIFPHGARLDDLVGRGSEIPQPTQGKTLTILEVDDLSDALKGLDGNVQTLGLAMADAAREEKLASLAARRGVDRIVKLGRMHVFAPPWDGVDLIRPMVRVVRHVPSSV